MVDRVWLASRPAWTGPDGVEWRRRRRWLSEREAHRFAMRPTAAVAVEHSGSDDLTWLAPEARAAYWESDVAGHVDDGRSAVPGNRRGLTYHVSTWTGHDGRRLVLLSEMC